MLSLISVLPLITIPLLPVALHTGRSTSGANFAVTRPPYSPRPVSQADFFVGRHSTASQSHKDGLERDSDRRAHL